ncbi:helix-turn-helix domain-containing protein [Psychroflexus halocasei]|nr:helix-turn-helix domain-containing protein [Psychroflexus halocasei]
MDMSNTSTIYSRKKLEKVEKLLINTDLKIQDIAIDLGFNSISSLNQVFKRRFGQTPMSFRKSKL